MGSFITFPELLILIPLLMGIIAFFIKSNVKNWAFFSTILTLIVSILSILYSENMAYNYVSYVWMKFLGSSYFVGLDGTSYILTFLTAVSFPLIIAGTAGSNYKNPSSFFGLLLLAQAGLMGVFCARDALVFYFYWELALIPLYFLCSQWGGEKRIQVTFKFFVYTFLGSLLMLIAIIYIYLHTEGRVMGGVQSAHSFSLQAFRNVQLPADTAHLIFWLFFVAFAIKMPIFPFHTWQPDLYDQSPYPATMVLSGIMVKMGVFGLMRWLIPSMQISAAHFANIIMVVSIVGIIYASLIAIVQDNLRKLVAYSSIAHMGLMSAALFSFTEMGTVGVLVQMFSHGINIIGLWLIVYFVERKTGTKKISELGGLAAQAPALTIFAVIIILANIALPLTNGFVGEFMMFSGVWVHSVWMAAVAALAVIFAAVYSLNMIRNVFYGPQKEYAKEITDISFQEKIVLAAIVAMIFVIGVYPQPLIEIAKGGLVKI